MKNYCTQNEGDCKTCSLTNYNRDCHNNPLTEDEKESKEEAKEEVRNEKDNSKTQDRRGDYRG